MPAAKKKSAPKAAKKAAKPSKKPAHKPAPKPASKKAEAAALKLIDEAAALLRKGITTSADTTEKARLEAKQKAHTLITKASHSLSGLLGESTSVLRKVVNKL